MLLRFAFHVLGRAVICQHEVLLVCHSARDVATNEHVIERVLLPAFDPSCHAYLTVPLRFFH